jgi:hypothetical protein
MAHLVETYAKSTGLRISKPILPDDFYPLGFEEPYIMVVTGTGMPSKNYDYFFEVVSILKPIIKNKYKIIQCGTEKEHDAKTELDLRGRTTVGEFCYLIKNASLVVCGDTSAIHIAGVYDIPIVSLFSITDPKISGAYFGTKDKQVYLTPKNHKPNFSPHEFPKTICTIEPERAANAALKLLGFNKSNIETIYLGPNYHMKAIEVVPDFVLGPTSYPKFNLNIRYDYGGVEENIFNQLSIRKCSIITDKPINIERLKQFKQNIDKVVFEIKKAEDCEFVKTLHESGINYGLITYLSEDEFQPLKLNFCDFRLTLVKTPFSKDKIERKSEVSENTKIKTNKVIFSEGKAYLSLAHVLAKKHLQNSEDSANVIDDPKFWKDAEFFYLFNYGKN